MKLFQFLILFIVTSIIPIVLMYLLLGESLRYSFIGIYVMLYIVAFKFADKFILLFLDAREIIEADKSLLFQTFKNNCYRSYVKLPRIYLYSGGRHNGFVLDNASNWSVVIDRALVEKSEEQQLVALVDYLVKLKLSRTTWLKTKGMGISAIILKLNYWFISNIFFLKKQTKLYRVVCFVGLMFLKPLLDFIHWFVQTNKQIECEDDLRPICLTSKNSIRLESFSEFLTLNLLDRSTNKILILEYLESYDIFKSCKFSESP